MTPEIRQDRPGSPRLRFEDAIETLSDEYSCRILSALGDDPMPAAELADECDVSRATVYRRLEKLESIGVVRSRSMAFDGGRDRRHYLLVETELRFEVGENGVDEAVPVASLDPDR